MNKVFDFIAANNIQPEELFALVEKVQTMDLSDEASIRRVIKDVSKLANRPIDKNQENKIVNEIMKNGINENIFDML
ncbi:MAG: stage VI sporulation protein F [Bacilli bacterium]|nr:stage VI sporulation protein F [Bacilli bacterium]